MKLRLSTTVLAAACLLGCSKSENNAGENKPAAPTPSSNASASAPASTTAAGEWKTTASGLKYQVMKQGTGAVSPKATDTVKVHYHGTLTNGTVFDSSVQRGEPASFPLNAVIPGWT